MNYPVEFLNQITPSVVPPHSLYLKVGSIVMLIRNFNAKKGVLNGTRLVITELHANCITAQIITGSRKGHTILIPRIDSLSDTALPFTLNIRQFPVIPSFEITINKSQGHSFDSVGVYLPQHVFSYGHLDSSM